MNPADLFSRDTDTVNLATGETLFREGDVGDKMYVLLEGTMDVTIAGKVVETAEPGALLGEIALIESSPRSATIVAASPCRLAQVDQRRFHFMVQQTPFFATHVMHVLAGRLRSMDKWVAKAV
ncbi:MAG: cyclic nucleotide-binding domain-containing protein [Chthoniobacteraceae bacterium]